MDFQEKMNQVHDKVRQNLEDNKGDVAIRLVQGMLDIAEKQYPKDFHELLERTGVRKDLALWSKYSIQFINQVESLEVDPWKNLVQLELNGEVMEAKLYDINKYIRDIPNLSQAEKLLIATYLGSSSNSKIIQIYHGFLK